jgi:hypothetical protein
MHSSAKHGEGSHCNTTSNTTKINNNASKTATNRDVPTFDSTTGYTDYAKVKEICSGSDSRHTSTNSAFPVALHILLSEIEQGGMESIICWSPHGRSVIVRDQPAFEKFILPK